MLRFERLRQRARALLRKRELERDMDDEMRFHLESEAAELAATRGLSPEEARRQAALAFGGVERFKEEGRDARGVRAIENLAREVRHASRTLRRSPGFTVAVTVTLALGIAAVTTVFTLVNRILIQPLPYPEADRLVALGHRAPGLGLTETGLSTGTYFHYRAHARSLDGLALYRENVLNLGGDDEAAERVRIASAGPEFFEVLGVQPMRGRMFREEDGALGFMDLNWTIPVLISHDLWQTRFGGDPTILGRVIRVNENSREVIGIMPPSFAFPSPDTKIWQLHMQDSLRARLGARLNQPAIARLRLGVTPDAAARELVAVLPSIVGRYSDATAERLAELQLTPVVVPLKDTIVGDRRAALLILLGGMAFLLLIACANVANLVLLRSEHRAREVAVRTTLGARRADLVRLFLAESAMLCGAAAALGLLLASLGLSALLRLAPVELPRLQEVRLDAWTVAFMVAVAALAVIAFTMLALLRFSRERSLASALRSGGGPSTAGRERRRLRDALVTAQVALALTLLVGSALMVRSFARLTDVHPGFEPAGLLTVEVSIPYNRASRHKSIFDAILERVRALPGTEAAAGISALPLAADAGNAYPVQVPGRRATGSNAPVGLRFYTTGYFSLMGIPIVEGIGVEPGDPIAMNRPVVISQALARRLFPNESPIGRPLRRLEEDGVAQSTEHDYTIVGVAADVRERSLREGPAEIVYVPILEPRVEQWFMATALTLVVRTDLAPLEIASSVRRLIGDLDPSISVARVRTMDAIVSASVAQLSFVAALLLIASLVALFLGAVGIYGVVAYAVRRRTQEIGIRIALGARPAQVTGMVLRESLVLVLAGVAVGVLTALAATRALGSLLYEVSATDPPTMALAALLLVLTALVASGVPARRAARTDAMLALRSE